MPGRLIFNADDWGQTRDTTDRTLDCILVGSVSSVSAMVFMADSERSADLAREHALDAGLHLNFSERFAASNCPPSLANHHNKIAAYLTRHRLARVFYHPSLVRSFDYTVSAQREEFQRLYGIEPQRLDGHHHLHLSTNVLAGGLLGCGTQVRRNFSFQPGDKSILNRYYRKLVDQFLAQRYFLTDYLFSLSPIHPGRLDRISSLARGAVVEVETHPARPDEYRFLATGEVLRSLCDVPIASGFSTVSKSQ
jgi:predicted glycoside hydrolase/deacetylase ChbG (UPF0249 family)